MAEAETALEMAKKLTWGTYGPGAVEAFENHGTLLPPLVFKTLEECTTDHLEAIVKHVTENSEHYRPRTDPELLLVVVKLVLENRHDQPPRSFRAMGKWFV